MAAAGSYALPRPLAPGATIGICQPSGVLPAPPALPRAVARLEALGFRVVVAPGIDARSGYFAGTAEHRLAGLHALVNDPAVDLVMAGRGGFGLVHLLPRIDWAACASSGKLFCGFSDFTAFHLGLHAATGQVSIAGLMATTDLAGDEVSTLHAEHVWGLLSGSPDPHVYPDWNHDGPAVDADLRGTLWGGNLTTLAGLVGTPWFPRIRGGLLFLEDIGEAPYRIERLLLQLELSGVLADQQAILLGAFTACDPLPGAPGLYTLPEVIAALRERFHGPVITGLPFGHIRDKIALPFGADARLVVQGRRSSLSVAGFLSR